MAQDRFVTIVLEQGDGQGGDLLIWDTAINDWLKIKNQPDWVSNGAVFYDARRDEFYGDNILGYPRSPPDEIYDDVITDERIFHITKDRQFEYVKLWKDWPPMLLVSPGKRIDHEVWGAGTIVGAGYGEFFGLLLKVRFDGDEKKKPCSPTGFDFATRRLDGATCNRSLFVVGAVTNPTLRGRGHPYQ